MTTLTPRPPYNKDEIRNLYPDNLELTFVQIFLRHGERTPVSSRFQQHLSPFWPYCSAAKHLQSFVSASNPNSDEYLNDTLVWKRRLETFGQQNDEAAIASGPGGVYDSVCEPGELTDNGRHTTLALGQRLRRLYVDQLEFMPKQITNADMIYIRATPITRALTSVQQAFTGLYPRENRIGMFPPPTIVLRSAEEETLFPNDSMCRRLADMSKQYAERAACKWNGSAPMEYVSDKISRHMPNEQKVAVDSSPRLSGILDTINSTRGHGEATKLPGSFYDAKLIKILEAVGCEEWFSGYTESQEYRKLGIGGLMGDIVARMVSNAQYNQLYGIKKIGGDGKNDSKRHGNENPIKLGLNGCHDTTLAAMLSSLGAFDMEKWPPYTSHIAVELFHDKTKKVAPLGWNSRLQALMSGRWPNSGTFNAIGRTPFGELNTSQKQTLDNYYVRLRYNDEVVKIPGCKASGAHLEGDDSFCTLSAFKTIVDKYTPRNWQSECRLNIGNSAFPPTIEPAGF